MMCLLFSGVSGVSGVSGARVVAEACVDAAGVQDAWSTRAPAGGSRCALPRGRPGPTVQDRQALLRGIRGPSHGHARGTLLDI